MINTESEGSLYMEKVLLAIDGITPDERAFQYAVELCLRIKGELNVLQVIGQRTSAGCLAAIKNKASQAKQYIEGSMMAAAFAEAGEYETADELMTEAMKNINKLLPESEKAGVTCHVTMKSGDPEKEIVSFVREHKDVVITVYDAADDETQPSRKKKNMLQHMLKALPIPIVMVQADA
jgi:hypothetical protein